MNKTLTPIIVLFLLLTAVKSNAQIPNADFENWALNSYNVMDPVDWSTYNYGISTSSQYQPAQNGTYAVKLKGDSISGSYLPGALECYFLNTQRPQTIEGYYQAQFEQDDTLLMYVFFYDNAQNPMGFGTASLGTDAGSYTPFSIPITFYSGVTPDSAAFYVIYENGTPANLSGYAIIDNLRFSGTSSVDEMPSNPQLMLWPNPASNLLHISMPTLDTKHATIRVFDLSGRKLSEASANNSFLSLTNVLELNTESLEEGLYILSVTDKNKTTSKPFLIVR